MTEYSTTSCINTVSIRELGPDEPARTLFGMTYDVQLTTSGRNCGIGRFWFGYRLDRHCSKTARVLSSLGPQLGIGPEVLARRAVEQDGARLPRALPAPVDEAVRFIRSILERCRPVREQAPLARLAVGGPAAHLLPWMNHAFLLYQFDCRLHRHRPNAHGNAL